MIPGMGGGGLSASASASSSSGPASGAQDSSWNYNAGFSIGSGGRVDGQSGGMNPMYMMAGFGLLAIMIMFKR